MEPRDAAAATAATRCPLCDARIFGAAWVIDAKHYWACPVCDLRFLDRRHHPAADVEFAHYRLHENHVDDPRYRRFLARLAEPLLQRLPPASCGLDYGCGPGPALAAILREAGHAVALYDPFFAPDPDVLRGSYHFVTCTETAEHFHRPGEDLARMMALVRPGGWLGIMTCFQTDDARFAGWHYRSDPTHVVFYRDATFRWLAARHGWGCEIPRKDVVLMRKPMPGILE